MVCFTSSIDIHKPLQIVCAALLDARNQTFWNSYLEEFEIITGGPNIVGSVAKLHYNQNGRRYVMEDKLIFCEPCKKYISMVEGDTIKATVETSLSEENGQTIVHLIWKGKAKNLFLKLFLPLMKSRIQAMAFQDLVKFKRLVEEKGVKFY